MVEAALRYHEAGLKVIPVWKDQGDRVKFPAWSGWSKGAEQTAEQVRDLFSSPCWGLAIICTDGIEVIDIDTKADPFGNIHDEYFEEVFWSTGNNELLGKCTTVKTKSGGYHLIYRTNKPEGNQKLCMRRDAPEAVIETRGEGGLIFAAPTPGYTVKRNTYENIGWLNDEERDALIVSAKSLSAYTVVEPPKKVQREHPEPSPTDLTPWDDYNYQTDVREVIERHGWTEIPRQENSKYYYYTKPGGTSGNIHAAVVKESNIFLPFTTGTEFDDFHGYTAYACLAILEHRGDYSDCAKYLVQSGFGSQPEPAPAKAGKEEKVIDVDLLSFVKSTRFSIHNPIKEEAATLTLDYENKLYKIGGEGMIGAVVGPQKSGKSLITSCLVASTLSGREQLGLNLQNNGKRKIFFDTEQSQFFYGKTQERIYQMSGLRNDPPTYETYHLRRLSIPERVQAIELILQQPGEIELIVIDGLVDICTNFNEEKPSIAAVENLMRWSDTTGAMLLTVLHTTKAMGYMRGHLGTALQNKCDFAFEVQKDPELNSYTVKCRESRFAPFPTFYFERDERGFPYLPGAGRAEPDEPDEMPAPYNSTAGMTPVTDEEIPFFN